MMSSYAHSLASSLMRTQRTFLPQSSSRSAFTILGRVSTLALGATESSLSRNTRSAAVATALAITASLLPGTASSTRRRRIGRVSLMLFLLYFHGAHRVGCVQRCDLFF